MKNWETAPKIFIIPGMPRTGTTFLYHNLQRHPEIFVPYRKEVNYFTFDHKLGEKWYFSMFDEMTDSQIGADISPFYFMDDAAPERIRKFNNDIKLILMVRRPDKWAVSFYNQINSYHYNVPEFEEFLKGYTTNVEENDFELSFEAGTYIKRIKKYCEMFGDDILICDFEILSTDTLKLLKAIENHIGVKSFFNESNFDNQKINAGNRKQIKFLTWLSTTRLFRYILEKILPRWLIRRMRNVMDSLSVTKDNKKAYDKKNLQIAKDFFNDDRLFYETIFEDSDILHGNEVLGKI